MEPRDVMQTACNHMSAAEALIEVSPSTARLHTEMAKLYVTMARESRIGNNRGGTYRVVEQKPAVIIPAPSVEAPDGSNVFGGDDSTAGTDDYNGPQSINESELTPDTLL